MGHFLWATCPSPSFSLPNIPSYSCHPFPALGPHDDSTGGQRPSFIVCVEPLECTPPSGAGFPNCLSSGHHTADTPRVSLASGGMTHWGASSSDNIYFYREIHKPT